MMKQKSKTSGRKALKILLVLLGLFVCFLALNIFYCSSEVVTTNYKITSEKLNGNIKIALLADLHLKDYGNNNKKIIDAVEENSPDIIAVAGDLTILNSDKTDTAIELLRQLTEIAPTYYAPGNHEAELLANENFIRNVTETSAHFLVNKYEYFEKNGEKILIGGIKQYPFFEFDAPDFDNDERHFFDDFLEQEKNSYSILICHYPECFLWKFNEYDIDLMLSGHTHGGLIRLPFIGGLYAPNQGFFPKYDYGLYQSDTATMVVTSGLANSNFLPRINNPGEVCIIQVN